MSAESTVVSSQHFRYLAERTMQEDDFLRELKEAAKCAGMPEIWISPEQASFMQIVLKLMGARAVIEVGTLAGYSTIALARALPADGVLRTIEISGSYADFAEAWIAKSDVAGKVEVCRGQAQQVLPTFVDDSADAAFIDADKVNYPLYLEECLRIVRRGGVIMVDNAFAFGQLFDEHPTDPAVPAVRAFNELMAQHSGLQSIIVPIGDGCWVGVKL
ncbi:MAG: O-methyltransferase [Phycisphaerae bacterium]